MPFLSMIGRRGDSGGGGAGVTDGDKGDIVVSGTGSVWGIKSALLSSVGRILTAAATVPAQRILLAMGAQANADFSAGSTITMADGTGHLVNNATGISYNNFTLNFPPNPVNEQYLAISTKDYRVNSITLNGNGKALNGPAPYVISLTEWGAMLFQYTTAHGWTALHVNRGFHATAGMEFLGRSFASSTATGWRLQALNNSTDYYFTNGTYWVQATASGIGTNPSDMGLYVQNTLDVSSTVSNYGRYSFSKSDLEIYNSSLPFGAGATNDRKVALRNRATASPYAANQLYSGQPSGAGAHIVFENAQLYFGSPGLGLCAKFDDLGNWVMGKAVCESYAAQGVATSGTESVPAGCPRALLTAAGTPSITLEFPPNPKEGQLFSVSLVTAYTAITLSATGKTLITGPALGMSAGSFAKWRHFSGVWTREG